MLIAMRTILIVFGILIAGLAATVLSDRGSGPAEFTFIEVLDLNTLDPQRMSYLHDNRMCYALYESLTRWDIFSDDFAVVPGIATHWDISEDQQTYTFHLSDKPRWSNGDPVTAHDFVYAWQRGMLPDTAAKYAKLFFYIEGAEDYFAWRVAQTDAYSKLTDAERIARFNLENATDDAGRPLNHTAKLRLAASRLREESDAKFAEMVGLKALDDHTLEVRLHSPIAYWLDIVCFAPMHPVHKPTVERFVTLDPSSGVIRQDHGWTKPGNIVSNGPYIVTHWQFRREIRLERNPHFWQPERAKSDTIKMIPISDPNTAVLAFESGTADWLARVTAGYVGDMIDMKERGELDSFHAFTSWGTYYWVFNTNRNFTDGRPNPLSNAAVRRAFNLALDRDRLCFDVRRSGEMPTNVFIPRGSLGDFKSPEGLPFDPERARAELASAGWTSRNAQGVPTNAQGEAFPTIELLCSTGSYHSTIAQAMAAMWEEHLGIQFRIEARETKVYQDNLQRQDYHMARAGWYGDYADPSTFLSLHRTGDGNNYSAFSDPYYDDLLDRAAVELDADKRKALYEEAERYTMMEQLPILPVWNYVTHYMFHPPEKPDGSPNPGGLRNISTHPRLVQYLWAIEVVQ